MPFFRLQELERRVFIDNGDLPPSVCEIKHQVEDFKHKLQVGVGGLCMLDIF